MKGPLVLIGLMGSGKTSVGRLLAQRLGWQWIDLDEALERRWRCSVSRQFARHGEAVFRARESAALTSLTRPGKKVLSTGGGVVLSAANRARLQGTLCIYLQASPEALAARLKGAQILKRPLLKGQEPRRVLKRLSMLRGPLYRESAKITIQAGIGGPQAVAERIIKRLQDLS